MLKTLKYPLIQDFYNAFLRANDDFETADGRRLGEYLMMMFVKNSRLRGHILTRKAAVLSWNWRLEPLDIDELTTRITQLSYQRCKSAINQLLGLIVDCALFGFIVAEVHFAMKDGFRVPVISKIYKPNEVYAVNSQQAYIEFEGAKKLITTEEQQFSLNNDNLDLTTFIIVYDDEPFRGGLLSSIAINEFLRLEMLEEWANWAKKQKGIVQGIDRGADEQERYAAEQALRNVMKNNYLISSDFIEFQFHQIANSAAGLSFKEFIQELNNTIAIAILGQANVTELPKGGGSRAALQVQNMITADIMYMDCLRAQTMIHNLLRNDYYYNYGSLELPYNFQINFEEATDYEANAVVIKSALASGINLRRDEVYRKLGFTPPREGEELIISQLSSELMI